MSLSIKISNSVVWRGRVTSDYFRWTSLQSGFRFDRSMESLYL